MFTDVFHYVILDTPLDEIQLRHGSHDFLICSRDNVSNLCRATKGVEQFFTIAIEARFVRAVHTENLSIGRLVCEIIFFRVICDEPFKIPEGYTTRLVEEFHERRSILGYVVKSVYG
tara:strand:+ start:2642 stop:2992 length:351 start_codon:yes stop_codon:yes gene_type:complete